MSQKSALFPYYITRITGGTIEDILKMNSKALTVKLIELHILQKELSDIEEILSNALFELIKNTADKKIRYNLVALRRDIHNGRNIANHLSVLTTVLKPALKTNIEQYRNILFQLHAELKKGNQAYIRECKRKREIFISLLKNQNFRNGLLLSSSSLNLSLEKYIEKVMKGESLPKVERTLLKYLTRLYTKPSPFSTYTHLALGKFGEVPKPVSENREIRSKVRLNNSLYQYIFSLLVKNKDIHKFFTLKLNSSIFFDKDQYVFHTNNYNRESIQRISVTPALKAIADYMQKKHLWIYHELISGLHQDLFASQPATALENYVDQLLAYGFLEFDLHIPWHDTEWDKKLCQFLLPLSEKLPRIRELIHALTTIRTYSIEYQNADYTKRKKLIDAAFQLFKTTCFALHSDAGLPAEELAPFEDIHDDIKENKDDTDKINKNEEVFRHEYPSKFTFKQHNLWYEDTVTSQSDSLNEDVLNQLNKLSTLLLHCGIFDSCTEKKVTLKKYFKETYGDNNTVDLLSFYESYSKYKKNLPTDTEPAEAITISRRKNKELLQTFIKNIETQLLYAHNNEITLTHHDIQHIPTSEKPASYGIMFQTFDEDNTSKLVINSTIHGYGNLYSRFLYLFPDDVTKQLQQWNMQNTGEHLLAEAADASVFNANIHPPLLPYEILITGSPANPGEIHQIFLSDLQIVYHAVDDSLEIRHKKTQQKVSIFNLGFQGISGRSELYQFLADFNDSLHYNIHPLTTKITDVIKEKTSSDSVITIPRITYEKDIILQRKTWIIPLGILPKRIIQETDWEYFMRINTWRLENHMPHEIFVKFEEEKPQYIHFSNPLLMGVFEKMMEKTKKEIYITEMQPDSNNVLKTKKKQVTEYLVQWYSK